MKYICIILIYHHILLVCSLHHVRFTHLCAGQVSPVHRYAPDRAWRSNSAGAARPAPRCRAAPGDVRRPPPRFRRPRDHGDRWHGSCLSSPGHQKKAASNKGWWGCCFFSLMFKCKELISKKKKRNFDLRCWSQDMGQSSLATVPIHALRTFQLVPMAPAIRFAAL